MGSELKTKRRGDLRPLGLSLWKRILPILTSTWFVGTLAAVAGWNVSFGTPYPGLDPSWVVGLYMAAHDGLHFGTEVIWTYGPLGFLIRPWLVYDGLAVISFLYESALLIAFSVSLVWVLRRSFNLAIAAVVTFVAVAALPGIELALALAAIWCLALLSRDPPPYARSVVVFGGGAFGAAECLVRLTTGPTILLMCAAALVAQPTRLRDIAKFAATAVLAFAALWFAAGQGVGNLPDYVSSAAQIISGYSQAMQAASGLAAPTWYVFAAIELSVMLVLWSVLSAARGRRQAAAGVVVAVAAFAAFKQGVVRFDTGHIAIFFATATALALALPWPRGLRPAAALTVLVAGGLALYTAPAGAGHRLNPISGVRNFTEQLRTLTSPQRQRDLSEGARASLRGVYRLSPSILTTLSNHTVDVEPVEAAVAWAYDLDWRPLPVFQSYSAYTAELDHDNAALLESSNGPARILRVNEPRVSGDGLAIDGRLAAWNPPLATVAMLCHYVPLRTTGRWQVLTRRSNRCGEPRFIGSVKASYDRTVRVPAAGPGKVVLAKIHGAGVSGLESLRTFLLRAKLRYAMVNGATYRLVPGTAADGLIMRVPSDADFPGRAFSLSPGARRISLTGSSGDLTFDFYAMPITSLRRGP